MNNNQLPKDPFNIIITGVGGQGNVTASRVLGSMLVNEGYFVTIGETFGASQRGGSVTSGMRVSRTSTWSPQVPAGQADLIVALEPTEALRVLASHGNEAVKVVCNTRPIHSVGVIAGDQKYPSRDELKTAIDDLSSMHIFIDATEIALELGNPVLTGVILLGAIAGMDVLPISKESFRASVADTLSESVLATNVRAFEAGECIARQHIASH
jgi:indolepyruvate ferredoxin oxidoreductase, beta subunit